MPIRGSYRFVHAIICALILFHSSSHAEPDRARLHLVESFVFGLGSGVLSDLFEALKGYDLIIVDGEEATKEQIAELKSGGAIVLGYLSVGTIERYRFWYKRAKPFRLDYWGDFGEWYADTSSVEFRKLISKIVAPRLSKKGFDGLFLDNVDMIREHRAQRLGMRKLVKQISAYLHRRDKYLFAQNGEDTLGVIFNSLDGWNREDVTSTYDFDSDSYQVLTQAETESALQALQAIKARGLLVTATDYVSIGDTINTELARANACSVGALAFVSNIELIEIATIPLVCD